jgi:hypothetical protein
MKGDSQPQSKPVLRREVLRELTREDLRAIAAGGRTQPSGNPAVSGPGRSGA